MPTLKYMGESFDCAMAIKGDDYIHLLNSEGVMIAAFDNISDFSDYSLEGGNYTSPTMDHDCHVAVIRDDGTIGKGGHRCSSIGNAMFAHGYYVGTGTAECVLTFDFVPKVLIIQNPDVRTYPSTYVDDLRKDRDITLVKGRTNYPIEADYDGHYQTEDITVVFDNNSVAWSAPATYEVRYAGGTTEIVPLNPASVFNESGVTYHYFAIG